MPLIVLFFFWLHSDQLNVRVVRAQDELTYLLFYFPMDAKIQIMLNHNVYTAPPWQKEVFGIGQHLLGEVFLFSFFLLQITSQKQNTNMLIKGQAYVSLQKLQEVALRMFYILHTESIRQCTENLDKSKHWSCYMVVINYTNN